MRAPPGYSSQTAAGVDEIIELRKAVYGLKQSSACFWTAMNDHLKQQGITSLLGDPCVFRKVLPSGKVILACTYVDDVTLAVPDLETRDYFMDLLRQRFVIDEEKVNLSSGYLAWPFTKICKLVLFVWTWKQP